MKKAFRGLRSSSWVFERPTRNSYYAKNR